MLLLHLMFSFFCLILMPLSTQSSLCHYTPHYPLRWHSKREPRSNHIERGFRAETKRTLKWMNCQQICLLSWVMDLAPKLFQQLFKQLFNSSCTTAPCSFTALTHQVSISQFGHHYNVNSVIQAKYCFWLNVKPWLSRDSSPTFSS